MKKNALILEGGGIRGIYSAGVLDFFASRNLVFDEIVGVSMGACNGAAYISNQSKRNLRIPMTFVDDTRYLSYTRWLLGGDLFGMDFIFHTIPDELDKFDWEEFKKSKTDLTIVATNCVSGKPAYFSNFGDRGEFLEVLKASCSLPFVAKEVIYKENILMDGGVSDPVPLHFVKSRNIEKIVIILTQPKDYRKSAFKLSKLLSLKYPNYKGLVKAMQERHTNYNNIIEEINFLEEKGDIFVIRPDEKLKTKRVDKNKKRIMHSYLEGVKNASKTFESLQKYLYK